MSEENIQIKKRKLIKSGWNGEVNTHKKYIIKPFLNAIPSVCVFYGPSAVGKTFFVLDMALSVASGQSSWMGYKIPSRKKVVYLTKEGQEEIEERKKAWLIENKLDKKALENYFFEGDDEGIQSFLFKDSDSVDEMAEQITEEAGENVGIVLVDTLSLFFGGDDENSNDQMKDFLQNCNSLAIKLHCKVIVIHHTRKDENTFRGAYTILANSYLVVFIRKCEGHIEAFIEKNKGGKQGIPLLEFNLGTVSVGIDDDGDDITNCVIRKLSEEEKEEIEKKKRHNKDLELLVDYIKNKMLRPYAIKKEERDGGIRLLFFLRKDEWADIIKSEEGFSQNLANKETNPRVEGRRAFRLCRDRHLFPVRNGKGHYKYFILGIPLDGGVWEIPNYWKKRPSDQEFVTSRGESFDYIFSTDNKFVDVTEEIKKLGIDLENPLEETKDFEAINKESIISEEPQDKEPIDGELFNN